jgi:hypothetical protein
MELAHNFGRLGTELPSVAMMVADGLNRREEAVSRTVSVNQAIFRTIIYLEQEGADSAITVFDAPRSLIKAVGREQDAPTLDRLMASGVMLFKLRPSQEFFNLIAQSPEELFKSTPIRGIDFGYTPKEKEIRDNVEANLKEINNQYLVATKEIAKATNSGYAAFCSGLDQDVIERLKELDPFSISHISRYLISGYKSRLPRTIVDEILKNGHKHAGIESSVLCCLGRG